MTTTKLRSKLDHYLAADTTFRAIYEYTRQRFSEAAHLTAHNWEHAYRDTINAIMIGEAEGADMSIVLPAAVMHDIGFLYGATGKTHGSVGAEKLEAYLREGNIQTQKSNIDLWANCIRTHKGSMHNEEPESLEAKVVSDADMLEKLGPIGVYQSIRTYTEFNYNAKRVIHNLTVMRDWTLQTATGQELVKDRKQFMAEFGRALQQAYEPYATEEPEDTP